MPLAAIGILGAVGSIGGAAIGASAAGNAADAQAQAAMYAADQQRKTAEENLAFQKEMWGTQQSNMAPWLNIGMQGENSLAQLMGLTPYTPSTQLSPIEQARQNFSSGGRQINPGSGSRTSYPGAPMGGQQFPAGTMNSGELSRFNPGGPNSTGMGAPGGPSSTGIGAPGGPSAGGVNTKFPMAPGSSGSDGQGGPMSGYRDSSGNLVPLQPWTKQFVAPTDVTEQNDPGYKFRLSQGEQALDAGAAARGTLLSGAGIKPYERFAQDYASNEYQNVYNRALGQYDQDYNIFENNQADEWNRFASLAGLGQTSASQLNSAGGQIAGNVGSMYTNLGNQLGQDYNNAGAARASGYVGAGNAWAGGLSGGTNSLMDMIMMSQMQNNGQLGVGVA